jgi:hypothetical protein
MLHNQDLQFLNGLLPAALRVSAEGSIEILDQGALRQGAEKLARAAALAEPRRRRLAQWLVRAAALRLGIYPASIHELYIARAHGQVRLDFTVPALNLRALPYHAARAALRAAHGMQAKAVIFELARSEMAYTQQTPAEYTAAILAAAIAEGHQGPVFLQGDHFQASPKAYAQDPDREIEALRQLIRKAVQAGFYNIDIDYSTLVDLSQPDLDGQQQLNYTLTAEFTRFARRLQPQGVVISLGGEIGEVGGHNSTEPELRAFMDGYLRVLKSYGEEIPGLSKISVQTGTSHGGVVLPDGSIAEAKVDFETLALLSRVARQYGMGGAVQHGASTLPPEAFDRFPAAETLEIHLATNFQNILYEHLPAELVAEMYAYLEAHHADERKEGQTDEQFYYKTRKRALGPFKAQLWDLDRQSIAAIQEAWEKQFRFLFQRLNVGGTDEEIQRTVSTAPVHPALETYLIAEAAMADNKDLAD